MVEFLFQYYHRTDVKIQDSIHVVFVASEYPSMTNKEIIQYTNVLFTQAPTRVCFMVLISIVGLHS